MTDLVQIIPDHFLEIVLIRSEHQMDKVNPLTMILIVSDKPVTEKDDNIIHPSIYLFNYAISINIFFL